jgi:hypothetical protein
MRENTNTDLGRLINRQTENYNSQGSIYRPPSQRRNHAKIHFTSLGIYCRVKWQVFIVPSSALDFSKKWAEVEKMGSDVM